jgi:signal peptidase I
MTEPVPAAAPEPTETAPEKPAKKEDSFALFLVKLVVAVVLFRTLLFTSFMIPSESMMPRLLVGDYLFAAKWSYGYSGASLPIDWDSGKPKIRPLPESQSIGLPGDTVQMVDGQLVLNGQPVPKQRVADFVLPIRASGGCGRGGVQRTDRSADGGFTCHFPQFRETLPNGVSYNVLDIADQESDNTRPVIVPEGHVFMMGDNRDNSLDSRFPAEPGRGVGMVPVENLVGEASFMFFSTDGSAEWLKPWTWFTAARWSRMGRAI